MTDRTTTAGAVERLARRTVKASATATVEFDGRPVTRIKKEWPDLDVMELATCRTWVSRTFRKMLNEAPHDHIVSVSYMAQMKRSPPSIYSGGKSGVNGQIMRTEGDFYNG